MANANANPKNENINTDTKPKDKVYFDKGKILYLWPGLLDIKRKARKISKKNQKDPNTYSEEYRYLWAKKAVGRLIKAMNIDIKVEGIENWLDRGVILAPNHESNFDPALLIAINDFDLQQPLAFIAKKELWTDKKMKHFMNIIDTIPLDRQSPRSALEAFQEGKDLVVDYKRSLVIFPEGTRSGADKVNKFQPASMKVAQMANAPIVPVTIIGSHMIFDPNRPKIVKVKVIFGKPIMPQKHISLSTDKLTANVQHEVEANMAKWKDKEPTYSLKFLKKTPKEKKKIEAKKAAKANPKTKKKSVKDLFKVID
ncbi:1-acyl-sn-glycerol-3-phosphate acyltransferase [Entomoplasma freundtii]|uniref:1-acyl-sn-glycerol-3-phosphate acyltransferase n=1 Tax=Entomoplasma freundtii TaxID=74700 RepID=A0A2K8NV36_9MOLU|nr:lysophospholipid acyltransferase family protein [Entomoplasma freundtii]ATZ16493.1 1-acyl-sn-glycerol-3-phosphate acyltransferase [Entomoplasma freundtii]TDY56022.1 1-acyl-sn-glycerol-3-phosphate acyltransferase [Entomoplasma freundtii]